MGVGFKQMPIFKYKLFAVEISLYTAGPLPSSGRNIPLAVWMERVQWAVNAEGDLRHSREFIEPLRYL